MRADRRLRVRPFPQRRTRSVTSARLTPSGERPSCRRWSRTKVRVAACSGLLLAATAYLNAAEQDVRAGRSRTAEATAAGDQHAGGEYAQTLRETECTVIRYGRKDAACGRWTQRRGHGRRSATYRCAYERRLPDAPIFRRGNMAVRCLADFGLAATGHSKIRTGWWRAQLTGAGGGLGTYISCRRVCLSPGRGGS